MIRRIAYPLLSVGWLACQSGLFHIDVNESSKTTVPRGSILEDLLGDLGFEDFVSMDITAAEELQNQGVEPGDIEEVFLTSLVLATDAEHDLSFLGTMEVYVESPGLEKVRVAWQDDFPEGVSIVEFNLDDVDLTEYVVSQSVTITTEVNAHSPDDDTPVEARIGLDVGVTASGACNQAKKAS